MPTPERQAYLSFSWWLPREKRGSNVAPPFLASITCNPTLLPILKLSSYGEA